MRADELRALMIGRRVVRVVASKQPYGLAIEEIHLSGEITVSLGVRQGRPAIWAIEGLEEKHESKRIYDLKPGERAWAPGWIAGQGGPRDMDHPCYPVPELWSTNTAYIERTDNGFKKLWIRGLLKRWWAWYGYG